MNYPFLIFALPRSRTAWLAAFLDNAAVRCHHEALINYDNFAEFGKNMGRYLFHGNADSGMALFPDKVIGSLEHRPHMAVIERDPAAVLESWRNMEYTTTYAPDNDLTALTALIPRFQAGLAQVKRHPDTMVVPYDMLDDGPTIQRLFYHLTRGMIPFPEERWALFQDLKIELSLAGFVSHLSASADNIRALMQEAA